MMFVFARSRPARYVCADDSPASNCASVSGSSANAERTRLVTASRSAAPEADRAAGSPSGPCLRITLIRLSASSGCVSHTSLIRSHSFGPRLPYSARNARNADRNSSESGSSRDSFHIARLGSAESTSPTPVISVSASVGSPIASATAARIPGPIEAPAVTVRCRSKSRLTVGSRPARSCHQFVIGEPGEVGALGAEPVRLGLILAQHVEVTGEHLLHPRAHLGRVLRAVVPGLRDVGRDVGVVAEVGEVDHLRGEVWSADAEHPRQRRVDVEIARRTRRRSRPLDLVVARRCRR